LVSAIPGLSYQRPLDGMKAMLRLRHLAPIYGGKTPIAPEAEDHLIIDEIPDIFVTGHVHAVGVDQYRGVVLVNSSTWQAQTPYRNDLDAYGAVLQTIRSRISAPIVAVFGNNEYANDHPAYVARFAGTHRVRFLQDEAERWSVGRREVRVIGSLGCLDRPTWWQRKNLPHLAEEYRRRIGVLDDLLAGDDRRILLTHYPPTYVTMGGEKEEWRPELGCKALEPILL